MAKKLKSDQRFFYKAFVDSVYDGDTFTVTIDMGFDIKLGGQKIRVAGINAPEMRGANKAEGKVSRDYVRELILNKEVYLRTSKDGRKGKYGRWIADVYFTPTGKGKTLNQILIEEKLAVKY